MSQEVRLTMNDYKTVISWFERLFGDDTKEPTILDKKAYQKLLIMHTALIEELEFMKNMNEEK